MPTQILFSPDERRSVLWLYGQLVRQGAKQELTPDVKQRVQAYLQAQADAGRMQRDDFGFHPVVRALQTAVLAQREIGLKGEVLMAVLLAYAGTSPEQLDALKREFSEDICTVIYGMQRVQQLYAKNPSVQSDNYRNLVVAMAEDMRVILFIIADRVNLLRLINHNTNDTARRAAATEAAFLYAPLAHKLGLYKLKSELEDLSLKYLERDTYLMIKEKLNATKRARDKYIAEFIAPIQEMLQRAGLRFHIKGRTKTIHSIWQKMKKSRVPFEGVYDLFAIRIIIDAKGAREKQDCWQAYSLITDKYQPNPKRLRDWLSVPKSNGYESLHITVLGPEQKWVEVQIRTERMDDIAEHGLAAHWRYKGIKGGERGVDEWLANIRSALEAGDDLQLMDQLRSELKEDEIYVFTPKGDLYALAVGATVLDFAYRIHSRIGDHCVGAMIDGKKVSLKHKLKSGDMVEIQTASTQKPRAEWQNIVVTSRAKAKLRLSLKETYAHEIVLAKELLERKLKNRKMDWDESILNVLIKKIGYKETSEFYRAIHHERIDVNTIVERYQEYIQREQAPLHRTPQQSAEEFEGSFITEQQSQVSSDVLVIGSDLKGLDFQLAKCCSPVYGDEVFGFVSVSGGIKIHRETCPNATSMRQRYGYRIVRARWAGKGESTYGVALRVVGNDDLGIVNNITSIISKDERITIRSIKIDSNDGLFSGLLTLMVKDTAVLERLIKKLRTVRGVKSVDRA
ncbi:MAG: TGS domain-containing protein [Bacteroidales bacterium]|nr:TGS domain-containing protein [Bacteroidales bacterium]